MQKTHNLDHTQCSVLRFENGTSLSFCSQKEKRDEKAMVMTSRSWAGPVNEERGINSNQEGSFLCDGQEI